MNIYQSIIDIQLKKFITYTDIVLPIEFAGVKINIIPIIIVFVILQERLIKGLAAGAVKG